MAIVWQSSGDRLTIVWQSPWLRKVGHCRVTHAGRRRRIQFHFFETRARRTGGQRLPNFRFGFDFQADIQSVGDVCLAACDLHLLQWRADHVVLSHVVQHVTDFLAHEICEPPGQPFRFDDERHVLERKRQKYFEKAIVCRFAAHAIDQLERPLQKLVAIEQILLAHGLAQFRAVEPLAVQRMEVFDNWWRRCGRQERVTRAAVQHGIVLPCRNLCGRIRCELLTNGCWCCR